MPLHPTVLNITLRLLCTILAGCAIGFNRSEHGRAAGVRTTLLVCLAASLSMILANRLIDTTGKVGNSFVQLDMMRLPLGVLSGIGFIGAGTIVRRNDLVNGVTTAATMWFMTMLGLCFGAGELALGLSGLGIALLILWLVKRLEQGIAREHRATLTVWLEGGHPNSPENELRDRLKEAEYGVESCATTLEADGHHRCLKLMLCRRTTEMDSHPPALLRAFVQRPDVTRIQWEPTGLPMSD